MTTRAAAMMKIHRSQTVIVPRCGKTRSPSPKFHPDLGGSEPPSPSPRPLAHDHFVHKHHFPTIFSRFPTENQYFHVFSFIFVHVFLYKNRPFSGFTGPGSRVARHQNFRKVSNDGTKQNKHDRLPTSPPHSFL